MRILNTPNNDNSTLTTIMLTLLLAAIGMLALLTIALGADNNPPCLTRTQAQAKWPGQWLYWHTADKCWDNVRVFAKPDREAKAHKGARLDANGTALTPAAIDELQYREEAERRLRTCCWPPVPAFTPWDERVGEK